MPEFYVYAYIDPRNDTPFYIGKGKGRRAYSHLIPYKMKNGLKKGWVFYRKLKKLLDVGVTPEIRIFLGDLTEGQALYWEAFLIISLGRRDLGSGCLCNMTNGGEGCTHAGHKHSDETKRVIAEKIRLRRTGWKLFEETKRKIGARHRGRVHTDESRERMSQGQKRRFAKPVSEATRERMSESQKASKRSPLIGSKIAATKWRKHWLKSGGTTRFVDISEVQSWVGN